MEDVNTRVVTLWAAISAHAGMVIYWTSMPPVVMVSKCELLQRLLSSAMILAMAIPFVARAISIKKSQVSIILNFSCNYELFYD